VLRTGRTALGSEDAAFFEQLVRGWSTIAYAGKPPGAAAGEALCRDWPRHFAGPRRAGA